jgi:hypothetical protein
MAGSVVETAGNVKTVRRLRGLTQIENGNLRKSA